MTDSIMLCSDLDRTLLPNGPQPESPGARELLHKLAEQPEVTLAYVTGRHRELLQEAIATYALPIPDYAVGDVGATIYQIKGGRWQIWDEWAQHIAPDWDGREHDDIAALLKDVDGLELQEPDKQNRFKLSYYAPETCDYRTLRKKMMARLEPEGIQASLIWSVDEAEHKGLMDVLPAQATKYGAIRFIVQREGIAERRVVFAGDSGNDLPALTSGLQAVLVRNASDAVRKEALDEVAAKGRTDLLYPARGGFMGMNGNYSAGVLEGLVHFIPEAAQWLT